VDLTLFRGLGTQSSYGQTTQRKRTEPETIWAHKYVW